MKQKQKQRQLVLGMLRARGSVGVHTAELRRAYIGNPSQRVNDLRDLGCVIEAKKERSPFGESRGTRYFLRGEPSASTASSNPTDSRGADWKTKEEAVETPALFDLRGTPYDAWEEDAA